MVSTAASSRLIASEGYRLQAVKGEVENSGLGGRIIIKQLQHMVHPVMSVWVMVGSTGGRVGGRGSGKMI